MKRFPKTLSILSLAVMLVLTSGRVAAQSPRSADASATVSILQSLTLAKTSDLSFGSHFASDGIVSVNGSWAEWSGSTDSDARISVSFSNLPASLSRVGGDINGSVPVTYGAQSAGIIVGVNNLPFDPRTGLASYTVVFPGTFKVRLGANLTDVTADVSGKAPGTYTGTITLTVATL